MIDRQVYIDLSPFIHQRQCPRHTRQVMPPEAANGGVAFGDDATAEELATATMHVANEGMKLIGWEPWLEMELGGKVYRGYVEAENPLIPEHTRNYVLVGKINMEGNGQIHPANIVIHRYSDSREPGAGVSVKPQYTVNIRLEGDHSQISNPFELQLRIAPKGMTASIEVVYHYAGVPGKQVDWVNYVFESEEPRIDIHVSHSFNRETKPPHRFYSHIGTYWKTWLGYPHSISQSLHGGYKVDGTRHEERLATEFSIADDLGHVFSLGNADVNSPFYGSGQALVYLDGEQRRVKFTGKDVAWDFPIQPRKYESKNSEPINVEEEFLSVHSTLQDMLMDIEFDGNFNNLRVI